MKLVITLIFIVVFSKLNAQQLNNTEWVRLLVENNVNGKTTTKQLLGGESIKYLFKEKTVLISINDMYAAEMQYSLGDSVLSIGKFLKYKVDSFDNQILSVKQILKYRDSIEKADIYTFLNTDYLFDYLKQTRQLSIIDDSVIVASNLFSPAYIGNIDSLFNFDFADIRIDLVFTGLFTISKDGNITDINIALNKKAYKTDVEKVTNILKSTKGHWNIPPTPKPFCYKFSFTLKITHFDPVVTAFIIFHPESK